MGKEQKFHTFKTIENVGPGSYNLENHEVMIDLCRMPKGPLSKEDGKNASIRKPQVQHSTRIIMKISCVEKIPFQIILIRVLKKKDQGERGARSERIRSERFE